MAWEQVKAFNLSKMGTKSGLCLQNVRLAYDIPAKYASAKDAMLANKNAGTLHDISTVPKNCAVPVFTDTASVYEHVMVCDRGVYYSDGRKLTSVAGIKFFGWGETLNGIRIVKEVADPQPAPSTGFKVGDKVTLKKYVDYNGKALKKTRDYYFISQLSGDRAVLNADSTTGAVYAAVNTANLEKTSSTTDSIKVGDKVTLNNWVDANGTRLRQTRDYYYVSQLLGDRAVLRADNATNGAIYAAVYISNLRKV